MKTGVIGGGIAGLVAAWSMKNAGIDVTVFERSGRTGFDAGNTVVSREKENRGKEPPFEVDVPLRLHNSSQWPQLLNLFRTIDVRAVEVDSSQSFCSCSGEHYLSIGDAGLFSINPVVLAHRWGRKIAADIYRFRNNGLKDLERGIDPELSFSEYLEAGDYSNEFRFRFLYPILSSTVCTCTYSALDNYPASIVVEALSKITSIDNQSKSFLFRSKYGSKDVAEKLLISNPTVFTNCSVVSVREVGNKVIVKSCITKTGECMVDEFDHVVVALQANHATRV